MALPGSVTSGNEGGPRKPSLKGSVSLKGSSKLFTKKQPGAAGKLGKASTTSESLSKLRGKGALA